jgi:hypothetical protein
MAYSHDYKRTTNGRARNLINNAKTRSKKKNVEVLVDYTWVEERLKIGICELTGIPFSFEPPPEGLTRRPDAPSLDRIDKTKHYTVENTRVILWAVNCALAEYGTETMLPILERMVDAIKNKPTSIPKKRARKSKDNPEPRALHGAGVGEDCDGSHHHRGEPEGEDPCDSAKESCRICMGSRVRQMEALELYESRENYGLAESEINGVKQLFGCVCHQP